ncbi:thermonuclease family protein [Allostella humosa]|uniref:thermonuclease family protein n=1 Tax=Stella humosa TaxID=94 RepID=UPI001476DD96|nr:thermonuclease family protein [Stella humosa]
MLILVALPALAGPIRGPARVADGDTLVIDGTRIRLLAIDAPEMGEPLGGRARLEMERIIARRPLDCEPHGHDRYRNTVAVCRRGRLDVAAELVRRGWARAWRRYGLDYVAQEDEAKAAGRGMWAPGMEAARASRRHP